MRREYITQFFMSNQEHFDYILKFIIIGDAGSGKSCILHQFIEGRQKQSSSHTIGVEFGSKIIQVGPNRVKLQIWDTAGQDRYRAVTRSYYRGAAGALVVYDITNRESFNHVLNWLVDARTLARPDISLVLAGNKCDLKDSRAVSFLEASRCAQENDVLFLETSALTGEGIEEVFAKACKSIIGKIEDGLIDPVTMGGSMGGGVTLSGSASRVSGAGSRVDYTPPIASSSSGSCSC
jgi:Ras-related protein Rab-4B